MKKLAAGMMAWRAAAAAVVANMPGGLLDPSFNPGTGAGPNGIRARFRRFFRLRRATDTLQSNSSLFSINWQSGPSVAGDGIVKILTDTAATNLQAYYRLWMH
jgi:hypothetical protein